MNIRKTFLFFNLAACLLVCAPISGQAVDTLYFDFWIETSGSDSLFENPAEVVLQENSVIVRTPFEFFTRYVTARGISSSGDQVIFFAGCDKIRLTRDAFGAIDGAFLTNRGRTVYFGKDPDIQAEYGWQNKTKINARN